MKFDWKLSELRIMIKFLSGVIFVAISLNLEIMFPLYFYTILDIIYSSTLT
jgi:hypothetical protein